MHWATTPLIFTAFLFLFMQMYRSRIMLKYKHVVVGCRCILSYFFIHVTYGLFRHRGKVRTDCCSMMGHDTTCVVSVRRRCFAARRATSSAVTCPNPRQCPISWLTRYIRYRFFRWERAWKAAGGEFQFPR